MIRFMQTSAAFKKYALSAILVVICIAMAWYLVPTFTGQGMGIASANEVVANVAGEVVTPEAVRKEAQRELEQQFPRGGAQARALLPLLAQRAAQQLIEQKVMLVEANRLGIRATDDDVRDFLEHQLGSELFPGGKFVGQTAYEDFASARGFTVVQLEQAVKDQIRLQKLQALVTGPANVTDAEVRQAFEKQNTKVKFDYAVIKKEADLRQLHS